jgi:putative nucleotidyltransferase with HDIG domain
LGEAFGFTSSIKLSELSDLSHPLLNELSTKAPGTLQHSMQVSHLSEKAAKAIGANDLLVKVAALYHDIGKSQKPQYFIENQSGDNPHQQLSAIESAKIIISHVSEGVKMAQGERLPEVVTNFIRTHHGTTRVEFFYRMHLQNNENGAADIAAFTYSGPLPRTREEVILMLADSIEASAKSLKHKTLTAIHNIVEGITTDKMMQGQFREANITFAEIEICKKVFKETLQSIYHDRIEYPKEMKDSEINK